MLLPVQIEGKRSRILGKNPAMNYSTYRFCARSAVPSLENSILCVWLTHGGRAFSSYQVLLKKLFWIDNPVLQGLQKMRAFDGFLSSQIGDGTSNFKNLVTRPCRKAVGRKRSLQKQLFAFAQSAVGGKAAIRDL